MQRCILTDGFMCLVGLGQDNDVDAIREIVKIVSEHGLNDMVLSAGLDSLSRKPPEYFDRLNKIKRICQEYKIEIIPIFFSVGNFRIQLITAD